MAFLGYILVPALLWLLLKGLMENAKVKQAQDQLKEAGEATMKGHWAGTVFAGLGLVLVVIFLVTSSGKDLKKNEGFLFTGLIFNALGTLPSILENNRVNLYLKFNGRTDDGQCLRPFETWLTVTARGLAKLAHGLIIGTFLGIPLWNNAIKKAVDTRKYLEQASGMAAAAEVQKKYSMLDMVMKRRR